MKEKKSGKRSSGYEWTVPLVFNKTHHIPPEEVTPGLTCWLTVKTGAVWFHGFALGRSSPDPKGGCGNRCMLEVASPIAAGNLVKPVASLHHSPGPRADDVSHSPGSPLGGSESDTRKVNSTASDGSRTLAVGFPEPVVIDMYLKENEVLVFQGWLNLSLTAATDRATVHVQLKDKDMP